MPDSNVHTVSGMIAAVQEQRFTLVTGDGRGLRFTLARGQSAANLRDWLASRVTVRVEYEGEPSLSSAVARAVRVETGIHDNPGF